MLPLHVEAGSRVSFLWQRRGYPFCCSDADAGAGSKSQVAFAQHQRIAD
jgi:hypothetical protein